MRLKTEILFSLVQCSFQIWSHLKLAPQIINIFPIYFQITSLESELLIYKNKFSKYLPKTVALKDKNLWFFTVAFKSHKIYFKVTFKLVAAINLNSNYMEIILRSKML